MQVPEIQEGVAACQKSKEDLCRGQLTQQTFRIGDAAGAPQFAPSGRDFAVLLTEWEDDPQAGLDQELLDSGAGSTPERMVYSLILIREGAHLFC